MDIKLFLGFCLVLIGTGAAILLLALLATANFVSPTGIVEIGSVAAVTLFAGALILSKEDLK
jgi:hypothetical protein